MNGSLVFGVLSTAGGLYLALMASRARAARRSLLRNCVRVRGRVVRLEDTSPEEASVLTWTPVVRYKGSDHREHELAFPPVTDTGPFRVGTRVPVYYERGNPGNAIDSPRLWDVNLLCAVSVLPILFGLAALYTVCQGASVFVPSADPPPISR